MISTLYEKMNTERKHLDHQITSLQRQIQALPDGKLICSHNKDYIKWLHSDGHKSTYLPKKQYALAEQLAIKKYLSLQKDYLVQERSAIDFYLRHHPKECLAEQLLSPDSGYAELLTPYFTPENDELAEWAQTPYERNPNYPEQLIHKTGCGIVVRSKSEAIIAMLLHTHKIPFRYECSLTLNGITLYPDFTIQHPHTGQLFYWEHFGMMDHPSYCQNVLSKLQLYTSNEIYPSIQLITTYETKEHPLDSEYVETLIKHHFT